MARKTRPPLSLVGTFETCLEGQVLSYCIKRSSRAFHARLEVRPATGLTVVLPLRYRLQDVPGLLEKKRRWILARLRESAHVPLPSRRGLKNGDTISYLGQELEIVERGDGNARPVIQLEGNRLVIGVGPCGDGALNWVVERWYRAQALNIITEKADEQSAALGVKYCRITIRGQKTRWGSCSPKGSLSFNWKLLMAPEPVIDYVVIHELAHLREMNHTGRFWRVVAEYCPRWREHKKWLREHGGVLAAGGEILNPKP